MSRPSQRVFSAGSSSDKNLGSRGLFGPINRSRNHTHEDFTDLKMINQAFTEVRLDCPPEGAVGTMPTAYTMVYQTPVSQNEGQYPVPGIVPEIVVSCIEEDIGDDMRVLSVSEEEEEDPHLLSPTNYSCSSLHELVNGVPVKRHSDHQRASSLPNVFYLPPLTSLPPSPTLSSTRLSSSLPRHVTLSSPPPSPCSGNVSADVDMAETQAEISARHPLSLLGSRSRLAQQATRKVSTQKVVSRPIKKSGTASNSAMSASVSKSPRSSSTSATSVYELFSEETMGDCTHEELLQRSKTMRKLVYSLGPDNFKTLYFEKLNSLKKNKYNKPSKFNDTSQKEKKMEEQVSPTQSGGSRSKRRVIFGDCPTRAEKAQRFCLSLSPEAQAAMEQEYAEAESHTTAAAGTNDELDAQICDVLPSIQ